MRILMFLIFTIGSISSFSQVKNGTYFWKEEVFIDRILVDGSNDPLSLKTISIRGQKFSVYKSTSAYTHIRFLKYSNPNSFNYRTYYAIPDAKGVETRIHYFKVRTDDVKNYAEEYDFFGRQLIFGVINFPFKIRGIVGNKVDFSGAFNIGAAVGLKTRKYSYEKWSNIWLLGVGIANVDLDASSVSMNAEELDSANNFSALSISFGHMWEYEKVQLGIFIGWDRISRLNHDRFDWDYQNKPWLSIGLGYSIFGSADEKKARVSGTN